MPFRGKIGFDRVVNDRNEGNDVPEGYMGCGSRLIRFILLQARVPESDLLLIVQPLLVIGP